MKKEVFTLAGSWIVAFEGDTENIENDLNEDARQSLFVMDDQQKIYLLRNDLDDKFVLKRTIDFSHHNKLQEVNNMRDNDWSHVHVTERTLTFGDTTYNLDTDLQLKFRVPKYFFGQVKPNPKGLEEQDVVDDHGK